MLFALVKTRNSCQPERAFEPTDGSSAGVNEKSRTSPASVQDSEESTGDGSSDGRKLFVPVKNRGKKKGKLPQVLLNAWRSCQRERPNQRSP